jgi:hypothetical protein
MLDAFKSAVDMALQGQGTRLMNAAESYKRRTVDEFKRETLSAGITVALVATALAFMLIGVTIGIAALYYWVALWHGTLAGLGAAGGAAVFLSLVLIVVAAKRKGPAPAAIPQAAASPSSIKTAHVVRPGVTADTVELGRKSVDAATGIVREGSREAVLATLAATVVLGVLLGRRR